MIRSNVSRSEVDILATPKDTCVLRPKSHGGAQRSKPRFSPFANDTESSELPESTLEGTVRQGRPLDRSRSVCTRPTKPPPSNSQISYGWCDVDRLMSPNTRSSFGKKWTRNMIKSAAAGPGTQKFMVKQPRLKSVPFPELGTAVHQAATVKQTLQSNAVASPFASAIGGRTRKRDEKRKWRSFSRLKTALFPTVIRKRATDCLVLKLNTPVPSKPLTKSSPPHGCPTNLSFQTSHRTSSNLSWWSKKDKGNRPPWFPAGMSGTISHHRQFRSLADRLKISNILHKVATQRLAESPRTNKNSPHRTLIKAGLECLPTAVSSRIRATGSCPSSCGKPTEKREDDARPIGKLHDAMANEYQQSSNVVQKCRTSQLVPVTSASVIRCLQPGLRSDRGTAKTSTVQALFVSKTTKRNASIHQSLCALNSYKNENLCYMRSGMRSVGSTGKSTKQRTASERGDPKSASTAEGVKHLLDSTRSLVPHSSEITHILKPRPEFDMPVTIKKDLLTSGALCVDRCTDADQTALTLGFDKNGSSSMPMVPNSGSPVELRLSPSTQFCTLLAPTEEPFGDWNASTTSTSHACSVGPVTYASLWDRTADGDIASDVISSTCMGSSLGTAPGLPRGPREADGRLIRKSSQGRNSGSEETLVLVTDVLDVSDNAHSSLASKINSLICAEELSLTTVGKAGSELEACEHNEVGTWSPMVETETSHIDSPQLVTTLRDDSPFFLLSEGDCELSHRFHSADADVLRHCATGMTYNQVRPPDTRSVQTYVDVQDNDSKSDWAKRTSVPKTEERNAASCNGNQKKFLRKLKWPVRNLSAMKKVGTL